jgi:hypothetical protein
MIAPGRGAEVSPGPDDAVWRGGSIRSPDEVTRRTAGQGKGSTVSSAQERPAAAGPTGAAGETSQDHAARAAAYEQETGYPLDQRQARHATEQARGAGAFAGRLLAGTLMIISGLYSFLVGLAVIIRKHFFVASTNYEFHWNISGWGWTELIIGIVVFAVGVGVLLGMFWARVVGVILAVLSAAANFMFLPYYPVWALLVIAVDVFIIWALVVSGRRQPA